MNDFLLGLGTTAAVIIFIEIFKSLDRKLIGSLTVSSIAFIYLGFSNWGTLTYTIIAAAFFFGLAYAGYKRSYLYTVLGLFLHGVWDLAFPHYTDIVPHGYDVFCLTIDWLLALYFILRLKKEQNVHQKR